MKIITILLSAAVCAVFLWVIIGIIAGHFDILNWHWGFCLGYAIIMFSWIVKTIDSQAKKLKP